MARLTADLLRLLAIIEPLAQFEDHLRRQRQRVIRRLPVVRIVRRGGFLGLGLAGTTKTQASAAAMTGLRSTAVAFMRRGVQLVDRVAFDVLRGWRPHHEHGRHQVLRVLLLGVHERHQQRNL